MARRTSYWGNRHTRRADMIRKAETIGHLYVTMWSPGDEMTRYRFHTQWPADYDDGTHLVTCCGIAEANLWLHGYIEGLRRYRKS